MLIFQLNHNIISRVLQFLENHKEYLKILRKGYQESQNH